MKKTATTQVTVKSGDRRKPGATDWTKLAAMTDEQVRTAAARDPDALPLDATRLTAMRRVSRVKALRERLGLTQAQFAAAYRLPLSTLRDWEQQRSIPDAPARALLLAIERDPKRVRALLSESAA